MKKDKMISELEKSLCDLPEGKGINLGEDVFLCGELDGSDKLYGFFMEKGVLKVRTRQSSDGYPIRDMDKEDLKYMFKSTNIHQKITNKKYKIISMGEV